MQNITIAGRKFKAVKGSTMENDVWNQTKISEAGLDNLQMLSGENADEFALRVFRMLCSGTDIFLLLGGLIIPVELSAVEWSEAVAEETAAFLRKCSDPIDKRTIQSQIVSLIMHFLAAELITIRAFPKSGPAAEETQPVSPTREAASPGEIGQASSENSLGPTATELS